MAQLVSIEVYDELLDDQISLEKEIEKLEDVCLDVFSSDAVACSSIGEQDIKNTLACRCYILYVYLEILGPPPWHLA